MKLVANALACERNGRVVFSGLSFAVAAGQYAELRGPLESGGLWDYDLQCERDGHPLLAMSYNTETRRLEPLPQLPPDARVALTLSLCGGQAFDEAFAARFGAA